jgi:hypothetical protein
MLQIVALCLLLWFAVETTRTCHRERAVFSGLRQTDAAKWLVWLYPLPFALPLLHLPLVGLLYFPLPLSALCFVPAIVAALQNRRAFDKSGDGKVKPAATAADHVITVGIMGMMGTLGLTAYLWIRR